MLRSVSRFFNFFFLFWHVDIQLFQHICWKAVFSSLNCLCSFVKRSVGCVFICLFLGLLFWSVHLFVCSGFFCFALFLPVPYCLDFWSFMVSLKTGILLAPAPLFFLKIAFMYLFLLTLILAISYCMREDGKGMRARPSC